MQHKKIVDNKGLSCNSVKEAIRIKVIYGGATHELETYTGEYRNLMLLIYDRMYVEYFGDCKGMGRCGTCMVTILDNKIALPLSDRNENTTIKKSGVDIDGIRLSCQIMVDIFLNNATVIIHQE